MHSSKIASTQPRDNRLPRQNCQWSSPAKFAAKRKRLAMPRTISRIGLDPWAILLGLLLLMLVGNVPAQATNPVDWEVGDVFVGTGSGNYQVWHSDNPAANNPTYNNVQLISDGLSGLTAGCGFDPAYRFFGTNFSNTRVDRYAIDNTYPVVEQLASGDGLSSHPGSVAADGGKNLYVGYLDTASGPGGGRIEQWTKNTTPGDAHFGHYVFTQSFPVPVENGGGPKWIDLASDGTTLFYTSGGRKIFTYSTVTGPGVYADLSTLNGNANQGTLFAIRILPPGDGSNGVLVADQGNVKLVKASGGVITSVQVFSFGNANQVNLQALTLDPINPATTFWVGDVASRNFFRFNTSTNKKVSLNTGSGTTLGGICVDGGFNAAEIAAAPAPSTQTFTLTPNSNTVSFTSPFTGATFKATLQNLANSATVTVRDSLVDSSVALSDPTVHSFNPGNPSFGLSTVPGNMVCDQTLTTIAGFPNMCEVFGFEANPNSGYSATNIIIDKPSTVAETTPNLRQLRNLDEDITDGVINYPTLGTKPLKCVFTVNQQISDQDFEICGGGFSSVVKNQNGTITFSFKVAPTGTCPSGQSPTFLKPLLMITQLQSTGAAPVSIPVIIAGKSGGPPIFVLTGNTWQLQVKTTDMPPGHYFATMVDLSGTITSIGVTVDIN